MSNVETSETMIGNSVIQNDTPPREQNDFRTHDTTIPRRVTSEPIAGTEPRGNTPFKGYPVRSLQMQERVRKRRELAKKAQEIKQLMLGDTNHKSTQYREHRKGSKSKSSF